MSKQYMQDNMLTDSSIMTRDLVDVASFGATNARQVPDNLNMKDKDLYTTYTRNVKIVLPGAGPVTTVIIPDVLIHMETFDLFGKTGVFVGVPQTWVEMIKPKLTSQHLKTQFEDVALSSDEKYWWTRCGFNPAREDEEYIFVVDEVDGQIEETPFVSFPDLFTEVGHCVKANVTCSLKMTGKVPLESKGSIPPNTEWRMGLQCSRFNITDFVDEAVPKPRTTITQKSVAGQRDKGSSKLLARIKRMAITE